MELESYASNCLVRGNRFADGSVTDLGTNNVIRDNKGYVTEASGTATIPAGATSVTVSHGLAATPGKVIVTPRNTAVGDCAVTARDATSFTITCETAPAADVAVDWCAEV